jgi:citrate lyase beta subunit
VNGVHVLYGGGHLFNRETPAKLAKIALDSFQKHVEGSDLFTEPEVRARVQRKLESERAVEALCIDFEDGYGVRADAEEDAEAARAATELAALTSAGAPPVRIGIRIKAMTPASIGRATRTLDIFLQKLGTPPAGFSVTLPKVSTAAEVHALAQRFPGEIELMLEHPRAFRDLEAIVDAAEGRCVAVHLGAYDLLSCIGCTEQRLDHPALDHARIVTTFALAERDITIFDGATTMIPVGETHAVHRGWTLHAINVRHAIEFGIFSGWDLHPAQLPARYGALFGYFLSRRADLGARLEAFRQKKEVATRLGQVFDDAATARGLENFFRRGVACGAFDA